MQYIIIDNFNGNINILPKDESGEPAIFTSAKEAQEYCAEEAQNGVVIPLGIDVMEVILDLIYSMDIAINPHEYESSKNLDSSDYMDLALCKADELGLNEKLKEYRENNKRKVKI